MTDTYRDLLREDESLMVGEPEGEPARYYIDMSWYDQHDRSFRAVAQGRFCQSCQGKIGTVAEELVPMVDQKTQCCSKQRNYITPETPLLEAVFRVFLANGNQPATVERIREQLGDWISLRDRPHNYAGELIERLIATDHRYGLRPFEMTAE